MQKADEFRIVLFTEPGYQISVCDEAPCSGTNLSPCRLISPPLSSAQVTFIKVLNFHNPLKFSSPLFQNFGTFRVGHVDHRVLPPQGLFQGFLDNGPIQLTSTTATTGHGHGLNSINSINVGDSGRTSAADLGMVGEAYEIYRSLFGKVFGPRRPGGGGGGGAEAAVDTSHVTNLETSGEYAARDTIHTATREVRLISVYFQLFSSVDKINK